MVQKYFSKKLREQVNLDLPVSPVNTCGRGEISRCFSEKSKLRNAKYLNEKRNLAFFLREK